MRVLLSVILILVASVAALAQKPSFIGRAPEVVRQNERFRLTYEINQDGEDFKVGDLKDFNVLGGPSTSSSTSMTVVNGSFTSSTTVTYSYVLAPSKTGKFTIPPASITVDGKVYQSNPINIEVVKGNAAASSGQQTPQSSTTVENVSNKDLFVRLQTSKKNVYEGEALLGEIKIYTKVQLQELSDLKIPQLHGFWREEIDRKNQAVEWKRENVNGEIYHTGVISQFVLIPQESGKLTIDPIEMEMVVLQQVRQHSGRRSVFDDFFNRGYQPVKKTLKSPAVTVNVKERPSRAKVTGDFKVSTDISKTEVKANESVTVKVTVSGKGNLKMIEPLEIPFPEDFEKFEPETNQNVKVSTSGISGKTTFEYLVIPRHAGTYQIPSVTLTAFNPSTGKLEELSTKAFELKVNRGEGGAGVAGVDHSKSQEDIKFIGKDIRYIKTGNLSLNKEGTSWYGSLPFYLTYILSTGAFFLLFAVLKKQRKEKEDQVGYKKKKAGALARKRLKTAEGYLKENQAGDFYKALLQGLYGYLGDKLNIQKVALSKGKIREELEQRKVSEATMEKLFKAIETSEMAQYAPAASNSTLTDDYQTSVEVISSLEEEIKA